MKNCDRDVIIVCSNTSFPAIKGHWDVCEICALEIYVSDSSINSVKSQGHKDSDIKLQCIDCVRTKMKGNIEYLKLSEEQMREIKLHFQKKKI